jgi:hypothetical protein
VHAPLIRYSMYLKTQLVHAQFKYARTMLKLSETSEDSSCSRHVFITHLSRTTPCLVDDSGTRPTLVPECRISCLPSAGLLPKVAVHDNDYHIWGYDTQSS